MLLSYSFARKHHCFIQKVEPDLRPQNTVDDLDAQASEHFITAPYKLLVCEATTIASILEVLRVHDFPMEIEWLHDNLFSSRIQKLYSELSDVAITTMNSLEPEDFAGVMADIGEPEDLLENNSDAPIIRVLNAILGEAIRDRVSDVHFDPTESELRIRFRIDGRLMKKHTIPVVLVPLIVSRIKVMARLDIAEKRLPQDGRVSIRLGINDVDLRVSIIPSSYGERIVLRILDKSSGQISLEKIGMQPHALSLYNKALRQPNGIILVTGPTGSGKTTTLYAGLDSINTEDSNIMTVEDPVEYNLNGISQTQVNTKTNMNFTKALRSILRQDPDIIMVGEIRDAETASIAVQASLTGHLVLSTLHTNTAIGAISRMRDLGVEPFLLSSSISCVMAQRLVRRLCDSCKQQDVPTAFEKSVIDKSFDKLYREVGCSSCSNTGFQGRLGIYEIIPIDDKLQSMIYNLESEVKMEEYAHTLSPSLKQSAIALVLDGLTTMQEMQRVTSNNSIYEVEIA